VRRANRSLTPYERRFYADFRSHLLDHIAGALKVEKRQRGSTQPVSERQLHSLRQRLWRVYEHTGIRHFGWAVEQFSEACFLWRASRDRVVPLKQRKSEYIGARLLVASALTQMLRLGSAYGFISRELSQNGAHISAEAIKTRASAFRNSRKENLRYLARRLFEEKKTACLRRRFPNRLPRLRFIEGSGLSVATRREIDLLENLSQRILNKT